MKEGKKNQRELNVTQDQLKVYQTLIYQSKRMAKWDLVMSVVGVLTGMAVSLVASAPTVSSIVSSIRIRWAYVWLALSLIGLQALLISGIWLIRKRNKDVLLLKKEVIEKHLAILNTSGLNPLKTSR